MGCSQRTISPYRTGSNDGERRYELIQPKGGGEGLNKIETYCTSMPVQFEMLLNYRTKATLVQNDFKLPRRAKNDKNITS